MDASEQQKVRRRAIQARHRATMSDLFKTLKNMVCPSGQTIQHPEASSTPRTAKWKILDHARGFLLEKESYLSKLLTLKEVYLDDDEGPKSLEEVREEYRRLCTKNRVDFSTLPMSFLRPRRCSHRAHVPDVEEGPDSSEEASSDDEMDELPQSQSSGSSVHNIQEFEGYLYFYRETLELLLQGGVLAPKETSLPVVSKAISDLWSSLPSEQREAVQLQTLEHRSVSWETQSVNTTIRLTINPPGPSDFEEDLLRDACDVMQRDMNSVSAKSAAGLQNYNCDRMKQIYKEILDFVKSHMANDVEIPQDLSAEADYEELFLRCSESFDEDL